MQSSRSAYVCFTWLTLNATDTKGNIKVSKTFSCYVARCKNVICWTIGVVRVEPSFSLYQKNSILCFCLISQDLEKVICNAIKRNFQNDHKARNKIYY